MAELRGEPLPDESTADLLTLFRSGDPRARDRLFARFLPILRRLAHGRLPRCARGIGDTDDLVQVTLKKAFEHIATFDYRGDGSFLAYLRQILLNEVRDQARKHSRRPAQEALNDNLSDPQPSPLEDAIGHEALERYESALAGLPRHAQEAIVLRIEYGLTYDDIARATNMISPEAARQLIKRSLKKLAEEMKRERAQ